MDDQQKAQSIADSLVGHYGEPRWQRGEDPVDTLIGTILSANTNDVNSGRAFDQLQAAFDHDWGQARTAPLDEIKAAIRPAGMYNQKAPHLVATLEKLWRDRGEYNLDFLSDLPVADALDYLQTFPGVGHKTASIVLLFCFNRGAFPVDTHVQRISRRLGVSGRNAATLAVKQKWEALLPAECFYALHLNLIRLGREICQAREARCALCPLQPLCDYYNQQGDWSGC